mgnify:FL=1
MNIQILTEFQTDAFETVASEYQIITTSKDMFQKILEMASEKKNILIPELFWKDVENLITEPDLKDYKAIALPIQSQAHTCVGGGGHGGIVQLYLQKIVR